MNSRSRNWRDICAPIIAKVIEKNRDKPLKEIKKAVSNAYCFGARRNWPYKVWLSEVKIQLRRWDDKGFDDLPLFGEHPQDLTEDNEDG